MNVYNVQKIKIIIKKLITQTLRELLEFEESWNLIG